MKLVKSLLLGSAAGLAVCSVASAADLPSRKAAPAEYVRVCSAYGAGFFYIPGTDVCLKVGGMARYQLQYAEPFATHGSPFGTRAQGRLELDARNPTAYGTLRAFVRVDVAFRTGSEFSGSAVRHAYAFASTAANDSGWVARGQTQVILDKAFVQWGGLVAGRTNSLFGFNKSPELIGVLATDGLYPGTNLLGYIATFGGGFYASLSLEDAVMRRQAFSNPGVDAVGVLGGPIALDPAGIGTVSYYGGFRMPDVVAAIGVEQSWGAAQISGAVHQIPAAITAGPLFVAPNAPNIESKYGWAVQGGVQINLPMIAPGDYLWLTATYAEGAMSYVHSGWFAAGINSTFIGNTFGYWQSDAYVNPITGGVSKSKTWGVAGAFQHYWAPTLRSAVGGSYAQFKNPGNLADWDYYSAFLNLIWSPVRQLDIGAEVAYQHIRGRNLPAAAVIAAGGVTASGALSSLGGQLGKSSDGAFIVRMRVQRSF